MSCMAYEYFGNPTNGESFATSQLQGAESRKRETEGICASSNYPTATTRMRPCRRERGAVFTTISTSRPSSVKKCISLPVEKPESCPRRSRDIFGWSIFRMRAALAWVNRRARIAAAIRIARPAFARRSSGFGSPRSAKTFPLLSSTPIALVMLTCYRPIALAMPCALPQLA